MELQRSKVGLRGITGQRVRHRARGDKKVGHRVKREALKNIGDWGPSRRTAGPIHWLHTIS